MVFIIKKVRSSRYISSVLVSVLTFFCVPVFSFAATASTTTPKIGVPQICVPEKSRVFVVASGISNSTSAGGELALSGSVSNNESFPIVSASVIVQVEKRAQKELSSYAGIADIVDRFALPARISLKPGSSEPFSYIWHVPKDLVAGVYDIRMSLVSEAGMPISGSASVLVTISSTEQEMSFIDATSLKINNNSVGSGRAVAVASNTPISLSVNVLNTHTKSRDIVINWRSSPSGYADEASLVTVATKTVRTNPGTKINATHSLATIGESSRFFVEIVDGEKKSMIPFSIINRDNPGFRVTALGLTQFPLEQGVMTSMFGCISPVISGIEQSQNTLHLYILDENGVSVADLGSNQINPSQASSFTQKFSLLSDVRGPITVHADIRDISNNLKSKVVLSYSCVSLGCEDISVMPDILNKVSYYILLVLALSGLLMSVQMVKRNKNPIKTNL